MSTPPPRPTGSPFVLDDSAWSHKAWMSQIDADLFERVIMRKARAVTGRLDVLEWGAGRSTLYFTNLLQGLGQACHWLSLEYDRSFVAETIAPQVAGNPRARLLSAAEPALPPLEETPAVRLDVVTFDQGPLKPFLPDHEADRFADLDDYVAYPRQLGRQFDLILVDGRKRRRCLIEAAPLAKPDGLVLLHDAYRPHYQCAFTHFTSHRMLGEILWIGSPATTNFLEWIT